MQLIGRGEEEIEVRTPNRELTEKEFREYNIRSNKNIGSWDMDILANSFDTSDLIEWGFNENELFGYKDKGLIDDDEVPEVKETTSKTGDLWLLDSHRLLVGDATKKEDVEKLIQGERIDMVFTDPPFDLEIEKVIKAYDIISLFNPKISFWMGSDKQIILLCNHDFKNLTRIFIHDWKSPTLISNTQPMAQSSLIAKFKNRNINNLFDGFSTILSIPTTKTSSEHKIFSQGKRVELPFQFIIHYSDRGDNVLDVFGGYGSTLIACEKTQRRCFMLELEPQWVDLIIARWEAYTGQKAVLK